MMNSVAALKVDAVAFKVDNEQSERPTNWNWGGLQKGPTLMTGSKVDLVTIRDEEVTTKDKFSQTLETTFRTEQKRLSFKNVPRFSQPTIRSFLQPLQEWEGYVTDISERTFFARLVDITAGSKIEEETAEFLLDDVSETDMKLLKEGAIFRWVIGYLRDGSGSKRRVSQIVFRRLPAWTKHDLLEATLRADALGADLEWED